MKSIFILCALVAASNAFNFSECPIGTQIVTTTVRTAVTTPMDSDETDEHMPMKNSDRRLIQSTWKMAKKHRDLVPKILISFLKDHPEYQKMYPTFAAVPAADLMKSKAFLVHAHVTAAGLDALVQSLTSHFRLDEELKHLGMALSSRNVDITMIRQFGESVVQVMTEELGPHLTREAKEVVEKTLQLLMATLPKYLKDHDDIAHYTTGLTPRQVHDVQRSWQLVRSQRNDIVSKVLVKLFSSDVGGSIQLSPALDELSASERATNRDFQKQVTSAADLLDETVSHMDNTLQIVGRLQYLGRRLADLRVSDQHMEMFAGYLVDVLSTRGVDRTDLDSWRSALRVVSEKIVEYMH